MSERKRFDTLIGDARKVVGKKEIKIEFLKINHSLKNDFNFRKFEDYNDATWLVHNTVMQDVIAKESQIVNNFFYNKLGEKYFTSDDFLNAFSEVAPEMDDAFFWMFWGMIFSRLNYVKRYADLMLSLTKNRMNISLEGRALYANTVLCPRNEFEKLILKLNQYEDDYKIKIFRGFKVREGKQIKDGNNHLEGGGLSYTLKKSVSIIFSIRHQTFWEMVEHFEMCLDKLKGQVDMDDDELINHFISRTLQDHNFSTGGCQHFSYRRFLVDKDYRQGLFDMTNKDNRFFTNFRKCMSQKNEEWLKEQEAFYQSSIKPDELKSYIGTYEIKKKDIVVALNSKQGSDDEEVEPIWEEEIIVAPENVKMLRYDPVNFKNIQFWEQ